MAHTNIQQLKKLLRLLDDERNDIFLHIDKRIEKVDFDSLTKQCQRSNVIIIPNRIKINWGGVSIMRAELELLSMAVNTNKYEYYHLLSGMDLPIKSQDYIHNYFKANNGYEFISFWTVKPSMLTRFKYYTVFPEGERWFILRIINHIVKGIQMLIGYRINRNINFRVGSQWFSITDDLARYVIKQKDWLEQIFKNTSTCDEVFLQTLVWNSPFKNKLFSKGSLKSQKEHNMDNIRLIDWTRGESIRHPWVFRAEDAEKLAEAPQLFARKFDENVDAVIVEHIFNKLSNTLNSKDISES